MALFSLSTDDFKFEVTSVGAPVPAKVTKTADNISMTKTFSEENVLQLYLQLPSYVTPDFIEQCVD